jgi:hypothetical protein
MEREREGQASLFFYRTFEQPVGPTLASGWTQPAQHFPGARLVMYVSGRE